MENDLLVPIRIVAEKTGISAHVIRMWERRYQALKPERSSTQRRLYRVDEIRRLMLLRDVTRLGYNISHAARMNDDELARLINEGRSLLGGINNHKSLGTDAPDIIEQSIEAIMHLDAGELVRLLHEAAVSVSLPVLCQAVVTPILQRVGVEWERGNIRVAQEHLSSVVFRSFLDNIKDSMNPTLNADSIIVTTPAGELHEFGALMSAIMIKNYGRNPIYLGPNLPAYEIVKSTVDVGAKGVALSVIMLHDMQSVHDEFNTLKKALPAHVKVIVGGNAAASYRKTLDENNFQIADNLTQIADFLNKLTVN